MNYAKLLEINSFFIWHIFLEVGKTQDMPSKIWQTLGDALMAAICFVEAEYPVDYSDSLVLLLVSL